MRPWPFRRRAAAPPSEDARSALEQAHRALADAQALGRAADDLTRRADEVTDRWRETKARNHFREAFEETFTRRARHP